jgi:hypothetical protein
MIDLPMPDNIERDQEAQSQEASIELGQEMVVDLLFHALTQNG